jgi:hypothetical protein
VTTENTKKDKTTSFSGNQVRQNEFSVTPRYGFFLTNHFLVGGGVQYSYGRIESTTLISTSSNNYTFKSNVTTADYSVSLFVRNYKSVGESFAFFVQSGIEGGVGNYKTTNPTGFINGQALPDDVTKGTLHQFNASIKPGMNYFISKKIILEVSFGALTYSYLKQSPDDKNNEYNQPVTKSGFDAIFDVSTLNLGIYYFISR